MNRTIKQAAVETGLSADTLRYYEKEGIVLSERHDNGYRYYDERSIALLKSVVVMKYAHFSLDEIKSMIELYNHEPSVECNEICKHILNSKIEELSQMIKNYQKIVSLMGELLPLVDSIDIFLENEGRIDEFIEQIFKDIGSEG